MCLLLLLSLHLPARQELRVGGQLLMRPLSHKRLLMEVLKRGQEMAKR
jgi:hypothetical protein